MKIAICGSMAFASEMLEAKSVLESKGHKAYLPEGTKDYVHGNLKKRVRGWGTIEGANRKIKRDLIRNHFKKIKASDSILVINKDKNGIKNYIGGNSFLEMGFAHVLNKKIFVLNKLPLSQKSIYQELVAMQPSILNGKINII